MTTAPRRATQAARLEAAPTPDPESLPGQSRSKALVPMSEADLQRAPRHRHQWAPTVRFNEDFEPVPAWECFRCGVTRDEAASKRGRNARNYGTRAELKVARQYGGEKIGHAGGPVDVLGKAFATQVKTHRRLPPLEWRKAFAGMGEATGVPRLLLRFVVGTGLPTEDYIVVPGKAWIEWFGKDE